MKTSTSLFKLLILGLVVVLLTSCEDPLKQTGNKNKSEPNDFTSYFNDSIRNYVSPKGTSVQITKSIWYTKKINGFGLVNLVLSGSTNAEQLTVRIYGDGLRSDQNVALDSKNSFTNDTIGISFTHAPTIEYITPGTIIKAYRGLDTLVITLKSGPLKY